MKQCSKCNQTKSFEEYNTRKKGSKDGYRTICKACDKKTKAKYYKNNKSSYRSYTNKARNRNQEYIYNYLLKNPCVNCGEKNPLCLDFDHINPSNKLNDISALISGAVSIKRLENEIKKCQVLCANCHRKKTAKQINSFKYRMYVK